MAEPETIPAQLELVTTRVVAADGHEFDLTVASHPEPRASLLFMPAMGVRASYYDGFARALAARGVRVGVADLRGHGTSSIRPSRVTDFGYAEILRFDYPAALRALGEPAYLGGHSLGGQLAVLAATELAAPGVAIVATCIPYWRGWSGPAAWRLRAVAPVFRGLARAVGHFPGDRIGFGGREARTLISDWGRSVTRGTYEPAGSDRDWEVALRGLDVPVLAVAVERDDWSPEAAITFLTRKCVNADIVRRIVPGGEGRHPHFSWVKNCAPVVDAIDRFIV